MKLTLICFQVSAASVVNRNPAAMAHAAVAGSPRNTIAAASTCSPNQTATALASHDERVGEVVGGGEVRGAFSQRATTTAETSATSSTSGNNIAASVICISGCGSIPGCGLECGGQSPMIADTVSTGVRTTMLRATRMRVRSVSMARTVLDPGGERDQLRESVRRHGNHRPGYRQEGG